MGAGGNTLVIFKSDNGGYNRSRNAPLRGNKGQVWEGGIRIPCLMRWPGVVAEGWTTPQVTLSMDLTATILAAAGAKVPADRPLDGVNLLPVLRKESPPVSRTVFWRYKRLEARRWAVADGDMKYVRDGSDEALHNLATDELERHNLIETEKDIAARLKGKLAAWERDVRAPRLAGFR
jgi:arylsulfatase A-like enzyme